MFENHEKKNNKRYVNDGIVWVLFVLMTTALAFFIMTIISKEDPAVFSSGLSGMTTATQNIVAEDVSVMITPAN